MKSSLSPEQRYAAAIVGILFLTLVLAGGLTWQGWRAARLQRVTADAAMGEYASFAARIYKSRVDAQLYTALTTAFRPLGSRVLDDARHAPPPAVIAQAIEAAQRCDCEPAVPARYAFRIDLATDAVETAGSAPPGEDRRWLAATVTGHARTAYRDEWDFATIVAERGGTPRFVFYTLRRSPDRTPRFAYGFESDSAGLARDVFELIWRNAQLRATPRPDSLPRDSVFAILVQRPSGRPLYRTAASYPDRFVARTRTMLPLAELPIRVIVNPRVTERLLVPGAPRVQLGLLVALLALTVALLGCAILLVWRATTVARLRADFTASVSHELRTPLAQIMLFAETMAHGRLASVRDYRREAGVILQEGRRLLHLVDNVLHFARAERLDVPLATKAQLLAPVVWSAVRAVAPSAAAADTVIRTAVDERVGATVDADALRRALLNVLENAVKYAGEAKQIIVGLALERDRARLWVDDQGPGIPARERERVWRPFTRLARDVDRATAGSGIGLAIVRDIVRRHGGRAWIEESPLGGARFAIELPAAWRAEAPAAPEAAEVYGAGDSGEEEPTAR